MTKAKYTVLLLWKSQNFYGVHEISIVCVCSVFGTECSETWYLKRLKQYLSRCDLVLTIPRKLFVFLKALPTILGCLVFLFSIILPFYYTNNFAEYSHGGPAWTYIWSFKAVDYHAMAGLHVIPYWFFNYWFSENWVSLAVSWIPLAIFTVQALVLAFGIASIHFKRRVMLAAPVCLSVAVVALMLYIGEILSYGDSFGEYQLGYYLVFLSLALFLSAFIVNEATKKQQTKDSISV